MRTAAIQGVGMVVTRVAVTISVLDLLVAGCLSSSDGWTTSPEMTVDSDTLSEPASEPSDLESTHEPDRSVGTTPAATTIRYTRDADRLMPDERSEAEPWVSFATRIITPIALVIGLLLFPLRLALPSARPTDRTILDDLS